MASEDRLRGVPGGCVVDLGVVESPCNGRHLLRVANLGEDTVTVKLAVTVEPASSTPWLQARWSGSQSDSVHLAGTDAEIELSTSHNVLEEEVLTGVLELRAESLTGESRVFEIQVRLKARRSLPVGVFRFKDSPEPVPGDFGVLDIAVSGPEAPMSYPLAFENRTSAPLQVSFHDLPAWLVFEVDGYQRRGPAMGRFFERDAPFQVELRPVRAPQFLGKQEGRLLLQTNDSSSERQEVPIPLSAEIVSSQPLLRVVPPDRKSTLAGEEAWVEAVLKNDGQTPARLRETRSPGLQISEWPVVPAARDGQPGQATLRIRVSPQLPPGSHELSVTVGVRNSDQRDIAVPVRIDVVAAGEAPITEPAQPSAPRVHPGLVLVVLVLLLLALGVIALASGSFSG